MGLMQIAEPGLSAAPHEERLAVGIDLGTTNSLVASVVSGAAEVIRDDEGRALLPSIVPGLTLRFFSGFPPLHLLHEKGRVHVRVGFAFDVAAPEFQQFRGPGNRRHQSIARFVDAARPLLGHAALGG